ncbi:hypothetical protein PYCCODRAFT_1466639 [Trametes coccinea BRFM310]|uniref:UbiA prenyltransferase n=1 Tax=Trametes coccinea (strain BRFM310) TaxID=1353009 RepID=A0A1Y2IRH7_TRAC3|nr:hypothetical protein PYCCODRAFT_1466639 [Trametes coccinea BRFM310]
MDALRLLVKVSRPAGWCFGPILYAIGAIHGNGSRAHTRAAKASTLILQLLSLSFPLALIVFGVNDVYDYTTDLLNPRKTADGLEGTVLAPAHHPLVLTSAALATLLILLLPLSLALPLSNVLTTLALLALSWAYSAPPPRLKERPVLDSLSNGAIIVLAYLCGYTARGGALGRGRGRGRTGVPTKGLVLGLCTAGVHALGAAVDVRADEAAGQRTIATALGARGAAAFGAFCYVIALCAERRLRSVFGVYLLGGLCALLLPLVDPAHAHLAFRAAVYWTVGMSAVWFADKARSVAFPKQRGRDGESADTISRSHGHDERR